MWRHGGHVSCAHSSSRVSELLSFADNPLYGVLHESIYAQSSTGATAWSAQRVRSEFPEFVLPETQASQRKTICARRVEDSHFTGEHVFPWQIEQDPDLAPMAEAAEVLLFPQRLPELYFPRSGREYCSRSGLDVSR